MLRAELTKIWKAFHCSAYIYYPQTFFFFASDVSTRGHSLKLSMPACSTKLRCRFLNIRLMEVRNGLPQEVIEISSLQGFKSMLTIFSRDSLYTYD